jgi:hypothetical protein
MYTLSTFIHCDIHAITFYEIFLICFTVHAHKKELACYFNVRVYSQIVLYSRCCTEILNNKATEFINLPP